MDHDEELDLALAKMAARGEGHRLSEVNPRNLAELFGQEIDPSAQPVQPSRALCCAGTRLEDQLSMHQLAVCIRIRPPVTKGVPRWDEENCIHATSRHHLAIAPPRGSAAYAAGDRGQTYAFSAVFDETTSQEGYYTQVANPLVEDCLRNEVHNSLTLAYGITAAGKTFTLEGTRASPGLIPRALQDLFAGLAARGSAQRVVLSYFEVYNETIHDLLDEAASSGLPAGPSRQTLRLKEDSDGRVFVAGLSRLEVSSADHALYLLRRGARQRARAETALNYASSRSHSIFQVSLYPPARGGDADLEPTERLGHMSFVDLAGSERAQRTGNIGLRLKESVAINSSLMTLGRCLEALRWNQQHREGPLRVLPYRESKVTHIFRDALHGYGQIVLSVNVSPCARDYDETTHVLKYAATASQLSNLRGVEPPRRTIKAVSPALVARVKRKAALPMEARGKGLKPTKVQKRVTAQEKKKNHESADADMLEENRTMSHKRQQPEGSTRGLVSLIGEESSLAKEGGAAQFSADYTSSDSPQVPTTVDQQSTMDDDNMNEEEEEDSRGAWATPGSTDLQNEQDGEQVAALKAHIELLLSELRVAEERQARTEAEVRAEVAAELGAVMEEMERNYAARLAAIEQRKIATLDRTGGSVLNEAEAEARREAESASEAAAKAEKLAAELREQLEESRRNEAAAQLELESLQEQARSNEVSTQGHVARLQAELDAVQAERDVARAELATVQVERDMARAELATVQGELVTIKGELVTVRAELASIQALRAEEQQQEAVNRAMEVEMLEAAADRERKRSASLSGRLEVALAALSAMGTPSRPLSAKLMAGLPGDGGALAPSTGDRPFNAGTPHDVALARARATLQTAEMISGKPSNTAAATLKSRFAVADEELKVEWSPNAHEQDNGEPALGKSAGSIDGQEDQALPGSITNQVLRPSRPSTAEEAEAAVRAVQESRAERRRRRETTAMSKRQRKGQRSVDSSHNGAEGNLMINDQQCNISLSGGEITASADDLMEAPVSNGVSEENSRLDNVSEASPVDNFSAPLTDKPTLKSKKGRKAAVRFAPQGHEMDENAVPDLAASSPLAQPPGGPLQDISNGPLQSTDSAQEEESAKPGRRGRRRALQPSKPPSAALAAALGDWQEGAGASSMREVRGTSKPAIDNPSRRQTRRQTALIRKHAR